MDDRGKGVDREEGNEGGIRLKKREDGVGKVGAGIGRGSEEES